MANLKRKKPVPSNPTAQSSSANSDAAPKVDLKFASGVVSAVRKSVREADVALASDGAILSDVKEWIPTGFSGLDTIFGGGWPVGRASEVSGAEGCGKSALAQMACVQTQKIGGMVVYLDFEHALDVGKLSKLGLDPRGLLYHSPDYLEQGWDVIWSVVEHLKKNPPAAPTLIVLDSVGGALAKSQTEGSAEDAHIGAVARVMTPNCARLFKAIASVRAHMLFINQEREDIGKFSRFGPPPKKTTGGAALKYAASLRVTCARVSTLKSNGTSGLATGYLIKTSTTKNRMVPPHRKLTWVLDFEVGPSPDLTVFETLKDAGKIIKVPNSSNYKLRDNGGVFERSGWSAALASDAILREKALEMYAEVVRQGTSLGGGSDLAVEAD